MTRPEMSSITADASRFLLAGSLNTLLSLLVYQAALFVLSPTLSYALSWTAGLAFLVTVYPDRVFPGGHHAILDRLWLALSYACLFVAGLVLLRFLVALTAAPRLAIVASLALTTTAGFLLSRIVLRRGRQ